jgi:hypothetical protein
MSELPIRRITQTCRLLRGNDFVRIQGSTELPFAFAHVAAKCDGWTLAGGLCWNEAQSRSVQPINNLLNNNNKYAT